MVNTPKDLDTAEVPKISKMELNMMVNLVLI
jgi:hypothetical protein